MGAESPIVLLSLSKFKGAALILLVMLSPVAVNEIFNIQSLIPGMFLSQIVALLFLGNRRIFSSAITPRALTIFSAASAFLLVNTLLGDQAILPLVVFLTLILLVWINGSLIANRIADNPTAARRMVFLSYYLLIALGLHTLLLQRSHILFVGEPSYFALILGPVALISYSLNRRTGLFNIPILFSFAAFLPNATFVLFGFVQLGWLLVSKRLGLLLLPLLLVLGIAFQLYGFVLVDEYFSSRFTLDAESANLSSLMFMVNWSDIVRRILELQFFGRGVGAEAAYLQLNDLAILEAMKRYGSELTYNAGTFWFARAMQSIGFVSLIVVFAIGSRSWTVLKAAYREQHLSSSGHLILVLFSAMIPEMFFRGASLVGYLLIFFFIALSLPKSQIDQKVIH